MRAPRHPRRIKTSFLFPRLSLIRSLFTALTFVVGRPRRSLHFSFLFFNVLACFSTCCKCTFRSPSPRSPTAAPNCFKLCSSPEANTLHIRTLVVSSSPSEGRMSSFPSEARNIGIVWHFVLTVGTVWKAPAGDSLKPVALDFCKSKQQAKIVTSKQRKNSLITGCGGLRRILNVDDSLHPSSFILHYIHLLFVSVSRSLYVRTRYLLCSIPSLGTVLRRIRKYFLDQYPTEQP